MVPALIGDAERSPLLIALIGCGIQASLSPKLHEQEAAHLGIPYLYRVADIGRTEATPSVLAALLTDAQRLGFRGLNITHPFKQMVIPLLDRLSDDAQALGAVNTVVFEDGMRVGHNTDWWGFAESLRRGLPDVTKDRAVLLGAGGAGAAVAHAMMMLDCRHLEIFDVDSSRAKQLAGRVADRFGAPRVSEVTNLAVSVSHAQGLINATPMGMDKHPGSAVLPELLRSELWVADIVYFPLETQLLRDARRTGCRLLHGGGMAVFQAAEAFRLFSGVVPDPERMLRHFDGLSGGTAVDYSD